VRHPEIIQGAGIIDHGHANREWKLAVTEHEHPEAWLIQGEGFEQFESVGLPSLRLYGALRE
jgi:hypothetical protein